MLDRVNCRSFFECIKIKTLSSTLQSSGLLLLATYSLIFLIAANPLTINDEGLTPLQMARNKGHVSVVRLLEVGHLTINLS